jgi:hypothetical protein
MCSIAWGLGISQWPVSIEAYVGSRVSSGNGWPTPLGVVPYVLMTNPYSAGRPTLCRPSCNCSGPLGVKGTHRSPHLPLTLSARDPPSAARKSNFDAMGSTATVDRLSASGQQRRLSLSLRMKPPRTHGKRRPSPLPRRLSSPLPKPESGNLQPRPSRLTFDRLPVLLETSNTAEGMSR